MTTGVLPAAGRPAAPAPAVPSHFYKLIYSPAEGGRAIAFLLANHGRPPLLRTGIRSIDQLEAVSGLDFFPALAGPAQRALEAAVPDPAAWPLDRSARAACGLT